MQETFGVFAVVHSSHAGDKSQQPGQPGIRGISYGLSPRRHGSTGLRHGAAQLRGQTLLAIDNATDVTHAAAAQWLATRTAVCDGGNIDMIGAVHAVLL